MLYPSNTQSPRKEVFLVYSPLWPGRPGPTFCSLASMIKKKVWRLIMASKWKTLSWKFAGHLRLGLALHKIFGTIVHRQRFEIFATYCRAFRSILKKSVSYKQGICIIFAFPRDSIHVSWTRKRYCTVVEGGDKTSVTILLDWFSLEPFGIFWIYNDQILALKILLAWFLDLSLL